MQVLQVGERRIDRAGRRRVARLDFATSRWSHGGGSSDKKTNDSVKGQTVHTSFPHSTRE
jgi:hypothetical protein